MAQIRLRNISLAFGPDKLLDQAELVIEQGDRIAILGRNGQGKSTLLKVIDGEIEPDDGEIVRSDGVKIARLQQEVPSEEDHRTVFEVVASGLGDNAAVALQQLETDGYTDIELEGTDIWRATADIKSIISRLLLEPENKVSSLSGGQKRRVMLARALAAQPNVLLMDEPTNHLDIDSVIWLEEFLSKITATLIFVTHDRSLIRKLANRIVDIDRGTLSNWNHPYDKFLQLREEANAAAETQDKLFDKKLKQEETWIRQGIKARRTRNEGRVRALKKLREERAQRRAKIGKAELNVQTDSKSGKLVFKLDKISQTLSNKKLINNFSTTIMRGHKIAIIGPNGSGKTTLLKIILGELTPDQGTTTPGTNLEIAYFDQLRNQLDETKSAADNVSEGTDFIEINGQRKHIMGYMQDFLFDPERARAPINKLSGGERNRLLLAKLFTKPANVLVLDEPTNDLDVETLELLEYTILSFTGTVLMVSHDREFIDNIATSTIVLEGEGKLSEYVGGYSDYLSYSASKKDNSRTTGNSQKKSSNTQSQSTGKTDTEKSAAKKTVKLSYKIQRELDELPGKIEKLEDQKTSIEEQLADSAVFKDAIKLQEVQTQYTDIQSQLNNAYSRWEELEEQATPK